MANDKFYGYSPKKETQKPSTGVTDVGTRLDRVNPYEFRKGMDVELTSMGVQRLRESTPEEREKATEIVLKNLGEHQQYYSALIQFEGGMDHGRPINETSFKKYLENYTSKRGDGMVEVNTEIKNDKMAEPKYDKKEYTTEFKGTTEQLKEAIKKEVLNVLNEDEDKEPPKKQVKGLDKKIAALDKEKDKLEKQRKNLHSKIKPLIAKFNNKEIDKDSYMKKVKDTPQKIKDLITRIGEIDKEKEKIVSQKKNERYEVAETAMNKEVHMKLLEIIKSKGVNLKEGAEGVRMYYEIAKTSYMEGLTAGLTD